MRKFTLLTLVFISFSMLIKAQIEDFEPNGKPQLRIYSNYHTTLSGGEATNAFQLTRVYLGYQHNFSERLSGAATLDVGDPGVGKLQMTAYVKHAYLRYEANNLIVNFGMISTTQFKVQENAWGYRYLEKSFQDAYEFNASADIGVSAAYKIGDLLSVDLIVQNGEGYKLLEADSTLRTGAGITLTPFEGLSGRVYYDYSNKINAQQSIATFIAYQAERFSLGAEYIKQLNNKFVLDHTWNGLSLFATVNTSKNTKVFARYDNLSSVTVAGETADWNIGKDGQLFIVGFEYSPVRGVKIAPNFKGWSPAEIGEDFISTFLLNCEVRF